MQDLAEVDGKILTCNSSETPQISDRNRLGHQADSGHRGKGKALFTTGSRPMKAISPPPDNGDRD